jgi:hypothetical protein
MSEQDTQGPRITIGSRWERLGSASRVAVAALPGDRVSFQREGFKQLDQLPSQEFLSLYTLVDEAEVAKEMPTHNLIYSLIDWKETPPERRPLYEARIRAAEAELDARIPPRMR